MTRRAELTAAKVTYETESDAEICVLVDGNKWSRVWIAKSLCTIDPPHPDWGDLVTITASERLLQQKGLI